MSAQRVEVIVAGGDGLSTARVAEQAGASHDRTLAILRELENAGRVSRSGTRRSTRWHPVTDEDRIAQRAAEIAASGRSA